MPVISPLSVSFFTNSFLGFESDYFDYISIDDDMFISTKNLLRFLRNPSSYPNDNKAAGSEQFGDELRLYAGITPS